MLQEITRIRMRNNRGHFGMFFTEILNLKPQRPSWRLKVLRSIYFDKFLKIPFVI